MVLFEDETGFSSTQLSGTFWRTMRYEKTTYSYYEEMIHLEMAVLCRSKRRKPQKSKNYVLFFKALTIAPKVLW